MCPLPSHLIWKMSFLLPDWNLPFKTNKEKKKDRKTERNKKEHASVTILPHIFKNNQVPFGVFVTSYFNLF